MLIRQTMVGGQPKATLSHHLEIPQIGAAATPSPLFDVIGEEPAQPQRIIAEMGSGQKTSRIIATLQFVPQRRERVIRRVVMFGDLPRPLPDSEVQQDRGDVIGHGFFLFARRAQRVSHQYVGEERERGMRPLPRAEEPFEQLRIIEQRVESLIDQLGLGVVLRAARTAGHEPHHQLSISAPQPSACVRENHGASP